MQIVFEAKPNDAKHLKDLAMDRLHFSLRRMAWQVRTVRVRFADVNGPRGGIDKHAQIQLQLDGHATMVVAAVASTWRSALEDALRRIVAKVVKTHTQAKRPRRHPLKTLALAHG